MADDILHLTDRELADRLGVSAGAARMKAKRAVKSGRWTIDPGNHPSDPVRVKLPAADIAKPERVRGERVLRSAGERTGRTPTRTDSDTLATALQSAQEHIAKLTDQLTAEKDQHRGTAIELATTTAKAEFLEAELDRLAADADELRDHLRRERRTIWQKSIGKY
ncbi:MAG: hypothetical protein V4579_09860 [Pseudomonadota bacterium]